MIDISRIVLPLVEVCEPPSHLDWVRQTFERMPLTHATLVQVQRCTNLLRERAEKMHDDDVPLDLLEAIALGYTAQVQITRQLADLRAGKKPN